MAYMLLHPDPGYIFQLHRVCIGMRPDQDYNFPVGMMHILWIRVGHYIDLADKASMLLLLVCHYNFPVHMMRMQWLQ